MVPTQNAVHPSLSRDGRRLAYIASSWASDVYAVTFDLARAVRRRARRAGSSAGRTSGPACRRRRTGSASRFMRASQRHDLVVTSADGSNVQRLTDDRIGVRCPAWSPDGRDHRPAGDAARRQGPDLRRAGRRPHSAG